MPKKKTGLHLKKPVSVLNKELKIVSKDLFKTFGKTLVDAATLNWTGLMKDAVDAVGAVGLKDDDAETRAYILVRRALTAAMFEIVEENRPHLIGKTPDVEDQVALLKRLDLSFEKEDIEIDDSFFTRPTALPLVNNMKNPLALWLAVFGLGETRAEYSADRLGAYFTFHLDDQWLTRPDIYEVIRKALTKETPFTRTVGMERAWLSYRAVLEKQVRAPVFGYETFGLTDIFVPLRAFYEKGKPGQEKEHEFTKREGGAKTEKFVVDVMNALEKWETASDSGDALRVITGDPGSGKSTVAKMFAARAAEKNLRVIFVPLFQFNMLGQLVESVGEYVRDYNLFPENPLDRETLKSGRIILVFDGTDELPIRGKVAVENTKDFIREVRDRLSKFNSGGSASVMAIITGRKVVIDAARTELRRPEQVLNLLPYFLNEEKLRDLELEETDAVKADQRDDWWRAYGKAIGKKFTGYPDNLKNLGTRFDNVTAQPLLNYLAAIAMEMDGWDVSGHANLNAVYEKLLRGVYERAYAKDKKKADDTGTLRLLSEIPGMDVDSFARVLQEIAVSAWHGADRTTTMSEVKKCCERGGCLSQLKTLESSAESGVMRLLTSFYFSERGPSVHEDRIFEFTHKSFREFLTARRLVEELKGARESLVLKEANPYHQVDFPGILEKWAKLCGPTGMDNDLLEFLIDQVALLDKEDAKKLQSMICDLIAYILREGMPMEKLGLTFKEQMRRARNAEESLLAALSACARVTEKVSEIDWPNELAAGEWLRRLQGDNLCYSSCPLKNCLNRISLNGQTITGADLIFAYLIGANLIGADLSDANLCGANLRGAYLRGADLIGADLRGADLRGANLFGADLRATDLSGADLSDAVLSRADLNGAVLSEADLRGAKNLTPEQLQSARNWEHAFRDEELACGKPIPKWPY